jgi:hypothetical protein
VRRVIALGLASVIGVVLVASHYADVAGHYTPHATRASTSREVSHVSQTQASYRELARQALAADLSAANAYQVPQGITVDLTGLNSAKQSATMLLAQPFDRATMPLYSSSSALIRVAIATTDSEVAAAQRVAAAQAAAAAKAAAAARARATERQGPSNAGDATGLVVNVWTTGDDQAMIDACRGAVAWTGYPAAAVVQHWTCGGSRFPRTPGSIVTLTGYDAGTYRVIGVVAEFDAFGATGADIPDGYPLLYQTCLGDSARTTILIALTPAG